MHDILYYSAIFLIVSTIIPFIRHDFWVFRIFEYPRLQKTVLNLALIILILTTSPPLELWETILLCILTLNLAYLGSLLFPYTPLGSKQIVSSINPSGNHNLKILIANVYQENRRSADYHRLIKDCDPDIVLMVETDHWWQQQMDSLQEQYRYQLKVPLENTYGMLLYSRLPMNGEVTFLVKKDIPSIEAIVQLRNGQEVKVFCLHPEPPVPQENPTSTQRDKEILIVAEKAKQSKIPVVVMGDLNDVAWSYTTDLFGKISGLLDPRRGRGFFNSFNAKYFFMRFPLDHIFCSADFALKSIKRLKSCGSDHFPMCLNLEYAPQKEELNIPSEATAEDNALAQEKISAQ